MKSLLRTSRPASSRRIAAAALTAAALVVSACGSDDGSTTVVTNGWESPTAGSANGAPTITQPTGDAPDTLQIDDIEVGDGATAEAGSLVIVDYIGALYDTGDVFDESFGRSPFSVVLGQGQVIKGWDEGLIGMQVGGRRQLIIPPELGYGSQAMQTIPANSTLIFIVELRSVAAAPEEIEPVPGGVVDELVTTDLIEGTGDPVEAGSQVAVHYTGVLGTTGETFDSSWTRGKPFSLTVGNGEVIEGWDEGLLGMKLGGRRRLEIPAAKAYGDTGAGPIPGGATLVFVVDLVAVS